MRVQFNDGGATTWLVPLHIPALINPFLQYDNFNYKNAETETWIILK